MSARDRLLESALQRFAADGALGATLDEIRADAGVSVGALYHHFPDKSALAGALYVATLRRFQDAFVAVLDEHPGAQDGITAGVRLTASWCSAHPAEARLLFGGRGIADPDALREINRDFFARTNAWYRTHAHYGAVRELAPDLVSALWLGPTLHLLRDRPDLPGDAVDALAAAAWAALRKDTP